MNQKEKAGKFCGFYKAHPKGSDFHLLAWLQVCQLQLIRMLNDYPARKIGEAIKKGIVPPHLLAYLSSWGNDPASEIQQETIDYLEDNFTEDIEQVQEMILAGCADEEMEILCVGWQSVSPYSDPKKDGTSENLRLHKLALCFPHLPQRPKARQRKTA